MFNVSMFLFLSLFCSSFFLKLGFSCRPHLNILWMYAQHAIQCFLLHNILDMHPENSLTKNGHIQKMVYVNLIRCKKGDDKKKAKKRNRRKIANGHTEKLTARTHFSMAASATPKHEFQMRWAEFRMA